MLRIGLFLITNFAVLLVAGFIMSVLGLDQYQNGQLNLTALLVMCGIFGMGGALISLFISKWMAKQSMRVQIIENPRNAEERWLHDCVAELAREAGIGMPEVGIFPMPEANAFATGWNRNNALVAVSEGLLRGFPRDEVRAVMAHEIGHVANGDMVTLSLIQGVVNTFVMFFARIIGHIVDRVVLKNERGFGIGYFVATMAAQVVLGILASMIVAWFSRWREYRADAAGARLGGRQSMIAALQRLRGDTVPNHMPESFQAFGIKKENRGLANLFASHPPLEDRIRALQQGQ